MMRAFLWTVLLCLSAQVTAPIAFARESQRSIGTVSAAELPKEARQTIMLIKNGGPYPYRKDGAVFGNFEKLLPLHPRGYYREFTVPTPRARDRGARRIIAGKAGEFYYTDDHYSTFRRVLDP
jgi:ribonuclease T1